MVFDGLLGDFGVWWTVCSGFSYMNDTLFLLSRQYLSISLFDFTRCGRWRLSALRACVLKNGFASRVVVIGIVVQF